MTVYACVEGPNVAIAVARRDEPVLANRPLILVTPHPTRPTVYAASAVVGVAAGVALRQALVQAPLAVCRPADPARDQRVSEDLATLLESISPRVAASAILPDTTVELDLWRRSFAQALSTAQQIGQMVRAKLQLAPAIGLATTRRIAQRAAVTAGTGATVAVPSGWETAFLARQPIRSLPIDPEIRRRLDLLGLRTFGAVAALPLDALQAQFGVVGAQLYRLVRGQDDLPIGPTPTEPLVERTRHFAGALLDRTLLEQAIVHLAARLGGALQAGGWSARRVDLTLALDDGAPWTAHHMLTAATMDAALLTQVLLALSRQAELACGVEAVTVTATDLAPLVATQLQLFPSDVGQAKRLRDVLGRLGPRQMASLLRATLSDPQARLPERRVRFDPLELS